MFLSGYEVEVSKAKIEREAKVYGMHYDGECKVIFGEEVKK